MIATHVSSTTLATLVAALVLAYACRTTAGAGADRLDAGVVDRPALSRTKRIPLEAITDARQRAFAARVMTFLRENAARDPSDTRAPAGDAVTEMVALDTDAEGRVLGGTARMTQPVEGGGHWIVEARFGADGTPVAPLAPMEFRAAAPAEEP